MTAKSHAPAKKPKPPAIPVSLTVTPGNTQAKLTWTAAGATSYKIYRTQTSGAQPTQLGATTSKSYSDAGLTNGKTYSYAVTAVGTGGESKQTAQVSVIPSPSPNNGWDLSHWTSDQVTLYYFDDIPRLMHVLNAAATQVYGNPSDVTAQAAAATAQTQLQADNLALGDAQQKVNDLQVQVKTLTRQVQEAQAAATKAQTIDDSAKQRTTERTQNTAEAVRQRQHQLALDQATQAAAQKKLDARTAAVSSAQTQANTTAGNLTSAQTAYQQAVTLDPANPDRPSAVENARQTLITARRQQQLAESALTAANRSQAAAAAAESQAENTVDRDNADLSAAQAGDQAAKDETQQPLTDANQDLSDKKQKLADAKSALDSAVASLNTAQNAVVSARTSSVLQSYAESAAFAQARDNAPYWASLPDFTKPYDLKIDPINRVALFGFPNSKTILVRGGKDDVERVISMIVAFDRPQPQAMMTLWTMQISSDTSPKGNDKTRKALKAIQQEIAVAQEQSNVTLSWLRQCISDAVTAAKNNIATGTSLPVAARVSYAVFSQVNAASSQAAPALVLADAPKAYDNKTDDTSTGYSPSPGKNLYVDWDIGRSVNVESITAQFTGGRSYARIWPSLDFTKDPILIPLISGMPQLLNQNQARYIRFEFYSQGGSVPNVTDTRVFLGGHKLLFGPGSPRVIAPSNLIATGNQFQKPASLEGEVDLSWDSSIGAIKYAILSATAAGGPYTQIATIDALPQQKMEYQDTGFMGTGLTVSSPYYYIVTAVNSDGIVSLPSNEAAAFASKNGGHAVATVDQQLIKAFYDPNAVQQLTADAPKLNQSDPTNSAELYSEWLQKSIPTPENTSTLAQALVILSMAQPLYQHMAVQQFFEGIGAKIQQKTNDIEEFVPMGMMNKPKGAAAPTPAQLDQMIANLKLNHRVRDKMGNYISVAFPNLHDILGGENTPGDPQFTPGEGLNNLREEMVSAVIRARRDSTLHGLLGLARRYIAALDASRQAHNEYLSILTGEAKATKKKADEAKTMKRALTESDPTFRIYQEAVNATRYYVASDQNEETIFHSTKRQFVDACEVINIANGRTSDTKLYDLAKGIKDLAPEEIILKYGGDFDESARVDNARDAAADEVLKKLLQAVDRDCQNQFIEPMFQRLSDTLMSKDIGVGVGVIQRTSILATNRLDAKVTPSASAQLSVGEQENVLQEAQQLVNLVGGIASGGATPALGGAATAVKGLKNSLGMLDGLDRLPPAAPPGVYGITAGNTFQVTPVVDPSGQALRFRFDHVVSSPIRDPNGSTNPQLPRIEYHSINTEVQLSNQEIRLISQFDNNDRLGLPTRHQGGVPILKDVPLFKDVPIIGWFSKSTGQAAVVQQSLVLGQTAIFPTVKDIIDLLAAPSR